MRSTSSRQSESARSHEEGEAVEEHQHYHGVDSAERHLGVKEALERLLRRISPVGSENIRACETLGRVLYEDVKSKVNVPQRTRSTRDGYALKVEGGALAGSAFKLVGEVRIGRIPKLILKEGEAALVATGSFVPEGANAVVMKEYVSKADGDLIKKVTIDRDVSRGENMLSAGEDILLGSAILFGGTRIEPHHIALFALADVKSVKVFKRPKIAFFSTGDELLDLSKGGSSSKKNQDSKIYDINRPFIRSMIQRLGAEPIDLGIARDNLHQIKKKMTAGLAKYDALILSAGSSVGERDYVTRAASSISGLSMLVHGVAMRPSSPTGFGLYRRRKPVLLLPGFPTSAIVSFFVFARPAIWKLAGYKETSPLFIRAKMLNAYKGKIGLTQFVRVSVQVGDDGDYIAELVKPTEAYFTSWLSKANGIAVVDESAGSLEAGSIVNVFLLGNP